MKFNELFRDKLPVDKLPVLELAESLLDIVGLEDVKPRGGLNLRSKKVFIAIRKLQYTIPGLNSRTGHIN